MSEDKPRQLTAPTFESKLPPSLLDGLNDKDKFLYQKVDESSQFQAWLVAHAIEHDRKLEEIRAQTTKTNGRLLAVEEKVKSAEPAINAVNLSLKIVKTRWFWIAATAFLFIALPWIVNHAPPPTQMVKWALGFLS